MSQIRVEILIPLYYNVDKSGIRKEIEYEKFTDTFDELLYHFGGYSANQDIIDGKWVNDETENRIDDKLRKIWIICEDEPANIDFLKLLKERLMERFQQQEILMYYTTVNRF